ncbi:MAG: Dabb family protein [Verrucomicrobiota bacterium]
MITHVVFFWAKEPLTETVPHILAAAKKLSQVPGVENFRFGTAVPSERAVVDGSYSVAISMDFSDQAVADAYQSHPIHTDFIENTVKPHVDRVLVYDFQAPEKS